MDTAKKLKEASACLGMIYEIHAKCNMVKDRIGQYIGEDWSPDREKYQEEACKSIEQMKFDFNRYNRRLKQIYKELKDHESSYLD